jgi:hypothetical protein
MLLKLDSVRQWPPRLTDHQFSWRSGVSCRMAPGTWQLPPNLILIWTWWADDQAGRVVIVSELILVWAFLGEQLMAWWFERPSRHCRHAIQRNVSIDRENRRLPFAQTISEPMVPRACVWRRPPRGFVMGSHLKGLIPLPSMPQFPTAAPLLDSPNAYQHGIDISNQPPKLQELPQRQIATQTSRIESKESFSFGRYDKVIFGARGSKAEGSMAANALSDSAADLVAHGSL